MISIECKRCNLNFNSKKLLLKHYSDNNNYYCYICESICFFILNRIKKIEKTNSYSYYLIIIKIKQYAKY